MSQPEILNDYSNLFPDVSNIIVPKNDLLANIKFNKLVEFIMKEIQNIPEHQQFKNDLELIKLICNIIENKVIKKDNVDKKAVVVESLKRTFSLVESEITNVETFIEFLHKNKKIKKLSCLKKYIIPTGKFFLKLVI
jgi:hypothetical protein